MTKPPKPPVYSSPAYQEKGIRHAHMASAPGHNTNRADDKLRRFSWEKDK